MLSFGFIRNVIEEPLVAGRGFISQPKKTLTKYLDDSLASLLVQDRACVVKTKEICRLDPMPLWDAQDIGATDLKIISTKDPTIVTVTFRFADSKAKRTLTYRLIQSRNGWRVHDIIYDRGYWLRSLLTGR
jgi:hypothetical protein